MSRNRPVTVDAARCKVCDGLVGIRADHTMVTHVRLVSQPVGANAKTVECTASGTTAHDKYNQYDQWHPTK